MPRNSRSKRKRPAAATTVSTDSAESSTSTALPHHTNEKRSKKNHVNNNNNDDDVDDDDFSSSNADSSEDASSSGSESESEGSSATNHNLDSTMICNYKTIPVHILTEDKSSNHTLHLYLRVHQTKGNNTTTTAAAAAAAAAAGSRSKRTLFVTNFPTCTTQNDLAQFFLNLGAHQVQHVEFGILAGRAPKPSVPDGWPTKTVDVRYGLVSFGTSNDVKKIMQWTPRQDGDAAVEWSLVGATTNTVSSWIHAFQQQQISLSDAAASADSHMQAFIEKKETLQSELNARRGVKDADGFQLVKKKHTARKSGNARASNRKGRTRNKKNGAGKELQDFYRFQMRENKRNKLVELRERFNEDKLRVETLRKNKKFKAAAK